MGQVALHPEGVDRNFSLLKGIWDGVVALHPEGVDRNRSTRTSRCSKSVALHPEGVDRNPSAALHDIEIRHVALHPEGVDRNTGEKADGAGSGRSPSTRRAWIEIHASYRRAVF